MVETTSSVMTKSEEIDAVGTSVLRNNIWSPFALGAPERTQTALAASPASQKTGAAAQHFSDSIEGTLEKNLFTLISEYLKWVERKQKAGIFAKLTIVLYPFQSTHISLTSLERTSLS